MIKYPYGMADFRKIITRGHFYLDRTGAIPLLEEGESQLFIRPRRFGKSLLLSMMENYYDVARKDEFENLFGGLAIGRSPTPLKNSYFVLRLDFSCVDSTGTTEDTRRSLYNHIDVRGENFLHYYEVNGFNLAHAKVDSEDALSTTNSLLGATGSAGFPVCLLVDEYDNFAPGGKRPDDSGAGHRGSIRPDRHALRPDEGPKFHRLFSVLFRRADPGRGNGEAAIDSQSPQPGRAKPVR